MKGLGNFWTLQALMGLSHGYIRHGVSVSLWEFIWGV